MVTVRQVREMIAFYQAGWSQDWIAERFGIAQSTVHYHLHQHLRKHQFRGPGSTASRLSHSEMDRTVFLYTVVKKDINEIGEMLGLNKSSVHERLQRAGVQMRSPSEAAKLSWAKRQQVRS
jgi:DNA-directed RNA polymerase specialized sigma24 family protein